MCQKNQHFFKELTPRSQPYELRGQGKKKMTKNDTRPLKWDFELRGYVLEKSTFFKELTPRSRTYELHSQGKKKKKNLKNKHLTLSYKNYLQKWPLSP